MTARCRQPWTPEHLAALRTGFANGQSAVQLARVTGHPALSVKTKMTELGLRHRARRPSALGRLPNTGNAPTIAASAHAILDAFLRKPQSRGRS